MNAIIDTNILYRISKILPEGDFSSKRIKKYLKANYEHIFFHEASLLELYTRFGYSRRKIRKVIKFLMKNELHPVPLDFVGFNPNVDLTVLLKASAKANLHFRVFGNYFNKRMFLEYRMCAFLIESMAYFILQLIIAKSPFTGDAEMIGRISFYFQSAILTHRDSLIPNLVYYLQEFYINEHKESWLKDKFNEVLQPMYFSLGLNYGYAAASLPFTPELDLPSSNQVDTEIQKNEIAKALIRKTNNDGINLVARADKDLSQILSGYKQFMPNNKLPNRLVNYYSVLVIRLLTTPKKISKNDFIDSEFMYLDLNNIDFLTLDGKYANIVHEFEPALAEKWQKFQTSMRK